MVEGGGLENRWGESPRGFESLPLRHDSRVHAERWPSGLRHAPGERVYPEGYRGFESHSLRHPVCCCRDFAPASRNSPRNSRDSAGFWPSSPGVSEPETAGSGPRSGRSPCFSLLPSWAVRFRSRFASAKAEAQQTNTESSNPTLSATQSAVAETSRPHPGTAREIPAIPRGFGRRALVYPNRRRRVPGLEVAAAPVFLCCQVGRFGFAPDSSRTTTSSRSETPDLAGTRVGARQACYTHAPSRLRGVRSEG